MILIADSGSTKTQWALIENDSVVRDFSGHGINPLMFTDGMLSDMLAADLRDVRLGDRDSVFFYGAGCIPSQCPRVAYVLQRVTGAGSVEVNSDMLGAARALCGDSQGIVCILGTGSNSCFYNGREIEANTPPLGYVLGDEGSGARLGIALVNGILKGRFPEHLRKAFKDETGLDKDEVIRRVYREPEANRFLASLTYFISSHIAEPVIDNMVTDEYVRFFRNNVMHSYPAGLELNFVGSLAEVFAPQLVKAARECGLTTGRTVRRPLPLLAEYHIRHNKQNHL